MNEKVVHVSGTPVAVRTTGTGPAVLFIHGAFVNEHLWDEVVPVVSSSHTCYLPTLPLGAHTTPAGSGWRPALDDLAGLITGLIQELDLHDVTVVANDTGGGLVLLALGSGHEALTRISRVVLTNCDSFDHLPPKGFGPLIATARRVPWLAKQLLRLLVATRFGRKRFMASVLSHDPGSYVDALFNPAHLNEAVRVTAALGSSPEQQRMAWLATLDIPVHLVWGDKDMFFPAKDAERLAATIPDATLTWVPGARTFVPLEDPKAVGAAIG